MSHLSPGSHSCAATWEEAGFIFQWSKQLAPVKNASPSPLHARPSVDKGCPAPLTQIPSELVGPLGMSLMSNLALESLCLTPK